MAFRIRQTKKKGKNGMVIFESLKERMEPAGVGAVVEGAGVVEESLM